MYLSQNELKKSYLYALYDNNDKFPCNYLTL